MEKKEGIIISLSVWIVITLRWVLILKLKNTLRMAKGDDMNKEREEKIRKSMKQAHMDAQADLDREIFRTIEALIGVETFAYAGVSWVRNPEPICKRKRNEPKFNPGW